MALLSLQEGLQNPLRLALHPKPQCQPTAKGFSDLPKKQVHWNGIVFFDCSFLTRKATSFL